MKPLLPLKCLFAGLVCIALVPFHLAVVKADAKNKEQPAASPKGNSKTITVKAKDITLTVPESWKQTQPPARLRQFRTAQFDIPSAKKDAEPAKLVIFHFRGGSGGGLRANVKRWLNQFEAKDRKSKITRGKSSQGEYVFVDISGTYNQPVGPPIRRKTKRVPNARMLAVILTVKDKGNYFLKLTGPKKTVAMAANAFRKSFGAKAVDEKKFNLDKSE